MDFDDPPLKTLAGIVSGRMDPAAVPKAAWPEVIDAARRHGLGPMLFRICKKAGVLDVTPHPEDLRRGAWAAAMRHALLEAALLTTGRALPQARHPRRVAQGDRAGAHRLPGTLAAPHVRPRCPGPGREADAGGRRVE